jgi:ABC-type transport system involved in multi-copper enzyme maturation permease subunit
MLKKIVFGLLWFIAFYLAACMAVGMIAGAVAGVGNPQNAGEAGALAGAQVVTSIRVYLALGSFALAAFGTWKEFLPGTKKKRPIPPPRQNA